MKSMPHPPRSQPVVNVIIAGLGGQGVLKASDILAHAAFHAGQDVKKSEVHGMSQRGGSVYSDVRFGPQVFSPMVGVGDADFLVVISPDQVEPNRDFLKPEGVLIAPEQLAGHPLPHPKSLNTALLGLLSARLEIPESFWLDAVRANLPQKVWAVNLQAFDLGRSLSTPQPSLL
jgi:indolepyruvate ferredoxin oxidoreductase, beta subunit